MKIDMIVDKRRLVIAAAVALNSLNLAVANPTTKSLTLDEAINRAVTLHEDIKIAEQEKKVSKWKTKEAKSGLFPKISTSINNTYYESIPEIPVPSPNGIATVPAKMDWEKSLQVQLSQTLWTFGKIEKAINMAKKGEDIAIDRSLLVKSAITMQTKYAYYSVLFHQESLLLHQNSHKNANRNEKLLKDRYQGRVPRFSKIKIQRDIATRVPNIMSTKEQYSQAINSLKYLLKEDEQTTLKLADSLKVPERKEFQNIEKIYQRTLSHNPEYKLLNNSIALQQEKIDLEKSQYYPSFALVSTYQNDGNKDKFGDAWDSNKETFAISVVMSMDIWDGGLKRARVGASREEYQTATIELQKWEREKRKSIKDLCERAELLRKTYESQLRLEKLAQKTYDLTANLFKTGQATLTDLNDAELNVTASKLQLLGTVYSLNIIKTDLENIMNK